MKAYIKLTTSCTTINPYQLESPGHLSTTNRNSGVQASQNPTGSDAVECGLHLLHRLRRRWFNRL